MSSVRFSGSFVEGFGDDLIGLLAIIVMAVASLFYIYWKWFWSNSMDSVHLESQNLAEDVRERMRHERPNHIMASQSSASSPVGNSTNQGGTEGTVHSDVRCPVCIDEVAFSVQTNCGHIFCGQCMVAWWQSGRWTGAAQCPVCRQKVTILLQCFSDVELVNETEEKRFIVNNICMYNRRFSGQPLSWHEYIRDLPTILQHCLSDFFSFGGLVWMFRIRILVCFFIAVLYLISPLDIIPEAVFGFFGLLDDFAILLLLAIYVSMLYRQVVASRAVINLSVPS